MKLHPFLCTHYCGYLNQNELISLEKNATFLEIIGTWSLILQTSFRYQNVAY